MIKILTFLSLILLTDVVIAQADFSKWFTDGCLRVDYVLAGDNNTSGIYLQQLKREEFWGGNKNNLIDNLQYGEFLCKVFSEKNSELIYSQGFCTLFQEWQTTREAKSTPKSFSGCTRIPFPKEKIRFEIYERNKSAEFELKFSLLIDPEDYFIQPASQLKYKVGNLKVSGKPENCVDIVFIPEGYTADQMEKFEKDINRLTDSMFAVSPFSKYRDKFNFYAVLAPSEDRGTDIPGEHIWKNTIVNSSFYTFDSERYLTTLDFWKVNDLAALAPYDQIYILVNSDKYGGGGVYNHYNLTSVDDYFSPFVFIHEFGHGFAGLGDEYSNDDSYESFYPTNIEPWEPNLTTLVNFSSKWESLIKRGTPVPTPSNSKYAGITGVFEGGGYVSKGVYRPAYNCRMRSNSINTFCTVCEHAIETKIRLMTQ